MQRKGGRLTRRKVYKTFGSLRSSQLHLAPLRARANFKRILSNDVFNPFLTGSPQVNVRCDLFSDARR